MTARPNNHQTSKEIEQLRRENAKLRSELDQYQSVSSSGNGAKRWKQFAKWASISLAGAIFIVASIVFYIGMTLTNTDRFMQVASPLVRQPAVQEAFATITTDALFEQIDIENLAIEVLPPKAQFFAPTIATQIEQFTKKQIQTFVASPTFQNAWDQTLREAHERFITTLKNYEGDGTINLNELFTAITSNLQSSKLEFLAGKQLPPRIGNITIIQADWLPTAHTLVSNFQTVRIGTILLFLALLAGATWISANRRRTIIQIAWMISILSFAMLLALRVSRTIFLDQADPTYLQAATEIWSVFTRPFAIQLITTLVIGLAVVFVAWIGSGSKSARKIQTSVSHIFAGNLHGAVFKNENKLTIWIGKNQKTLLSIIGVLFVLSLLFIEINIGKLLLAAGVAILISLAIITLSASDVRSKN